MHNPRVKGIVKGGGIVPIPGHYYVSNIGNDANDGLTDATALAHHPWMSTFTGTIVLQPGDVVYMRRGDTWTIAAPAAPYMTVAQSGWAGSPITTTAYGVGARPIINISTLTAQVVILINGYSYLVFDNLDISHCQEARNLGGNYTGIFMTDAGGIIPHDITITNCLIHECPNCGIASGNNIYNITIGDITVNTTATAINFSNEIYHCGYAGISFAGCNPVTLRSDLKVYYNYIHEIDNLVSILRSVYAISFSYNALSAGVPQYCYAEYNLIENVPNWHGISSHGGQYLYYRNNRIYNCQYNIAAMAATIPPHVDTCNDVYIENNEIENPGNHPFAEYKGITLYSNPAHIVPTNGLIRNNTIFYTARPGAEILAYGIVVHSCVGVIIENNYIYNGSTINSLGAISTANGSFLNVTIRKNFILNWSYGIHIHPNSLDGNIEISNNIVHAHTCCIYGETAHIIDFNINIFNNIFISDFIIDGQFFLFSGTQISATGSMYILNNIIATSAVSALGWYIRTPNPINGIFVSNYNCFWNVSRASAFYYLGAAVNFAAWQAAGFDLNGLNNTNPLFTNGSGTYSLVTDFTTQALSPARLAGVDVGLTDDYWGNPVNVPPDIGAYQS